MWTLSSDYFVLFILLFNHFQYDFNAKIKTYSANCYDSKPVIAKTVQQAYLGLHGDETMTTMAGQS